jgi:hypothetical protein
MTPKEKAQELIEKYLKLDIEIGGQYDGYLTMKMHDAKQCALITVDEIILSAPFEPVDTDWDEAGSSAQYWYPQKLEDSAKWWGAVKQEINNL